MAACSPAKTYVTPLVAALPAGDFVEQCLGTEMASGFRVDVFEFSGGSTDPMAGESPCGQCADGSASCRPLFAECRCSGWRSTPEAIIEALSGMRVEHLEPDMPLCARVTIYDRAAAEGVESGAAQTCSCDDAEDGALSLCALSDLGSVNDSETPLVIREFRCASAIGCGFTDCDLLDRVGAIDCSLFTSAERRDSCESLTEFVNAQHDRCCGTIPDAVSACAGF